MQFATLNEEKMFPITRIRQNYFITVSPCINDAHAKFYKWNRMFGVLKLFYVRI